MDKKKKLLLIIPVPIICILLILGASYYFYFYPRTQTKAINSQISLNKNQLLAKFLPSDFNISFKEVSVESSTTFTEEELTDLFIAAIQEIPEVKEYVSGLKVDIQGENINIYTDILYKKKIPVQVKLTFTGACKDGKGIFHYDYGRVGLMDISKETIFKDLKNTSMLQFDPKNGDIILSFENIKLLNVSDVKVQNNSVNIVFKGTIKFWDWLSKK